MTTKSLAFVMSRKLFWSWVRASLELQNTWSQCVLHYHVSTPREKTIDEFIFLDGL